MAGSLKFLNLLTAGGWRPSDQSGLAWWYELDSGVTTSGGNVTAITDKSGNGNTLNHNGANFAYNNPDGTLPGALNKSVSAVTLGELAAVTHSSIEFGTGDFVIAMLVYLNAVNGGKISTKDTYAGDLGVYNGWYMQSMNTGTGYKFGTQSVPTDYNVDTSATTVSTWYRFMMTRTSGVVRLYVNNVEDGTFTESPILNLTNAAPLRIGLNGAWDGGANFKIAAHLGYKAVTADSVLRTKIDTYLKNRGGL